MTILWMKKVLRRSPKSLRHFEIVVESGAAERTAPGVGVEPEEERVVARSTDIYDVYLLDFV